MSTRVLLVIFALLVMVSLGTFTGLVVSACQGKQTTALRIRCEIQEGVYPDGTPEGCRGPRADRISCTYLHDQADACRSYTGEERTGCYRQLAKVSDPLNTSTTAATRDYLVVLLDELEVRAVEHYRSHDIPLQDATDLVTQIGGIKKAVIARQTAPEIRVQVSGLKDRWERKIT